MSAIAIAATWRRHRRAGDAAHCSARSEGRHPQVFERLPKRLKAHLEAECSNLLDVRLKHGTRRSALRIATSRGGKLPRRRDRRRHRERFFQGRGPIGIVVEDGSSRSIDPAARSPRPLVDDGLHRLDADRTIFESFVRLTDEGVFVIAASRRKRGQRIPRGYNRLRYIPAQIALDPPGIAVSVDAALELGRR